MALQDAYTTLSVLGIPGLRPLYTAKQAEYGIGKLGVYRLEAGTYLIKWEAVGSPPYRIFLDGVHVATTYSRNSDGVSSFVLFVENDDEVRIVEVLDDPNAEPTAVNPQRFELSWTPVDDAASYRLEKYVDGAWAREEEIVADAALSVYRAVSVTLDDDTSHQYRVVPVGTNGNDGTPVAVTKHMIRHPDPPQVTVAVNVDRTLTITEAA